MGWRQPTNLHEWLGILPRHKKKFFFSSVPVMIVVVVSSQWIEREYRAKAMFERINDAALEQMGSTTIDRNLRSIRQTINQDIRGRQAVEQLIEDLHLLRDLPHTADGELTAEGRMAKNDTIGQVASRIGIRFVTKSAFQDQIVVTFTHEDRELAPRVVNQIVENYIRKTRQQLDTMLLNAKTFFEQEVSRYRSRIAELDAKKLRFQMDHPGLTPQNPASVERRLEGKRGQLAKVTMNLRIAIEKRAKIQEWVGEQPEFYEKSLVESNPELVAIQGKIHTIRGQIERDIYQMGRTEEHPAVVKARIRLAELDAAAKRLREQVVVSKELVPNTDRMSAQREAETLTGTILALEGSAKQLTQEVEKLELLSRNFFVVRNEYIQVNRELGQAKNQLKFWDRNLGRTLTALTAEVGQRGVRMRLLERAPDLARPSNPTLPGILMAAIVLGAGSGVLLIIVAELLDHSFRNVEQAVDELKLPVLGTVNEIIMPSEVFRRRVVGWGLYPTVGTLMVFALLGCVYLAYVSLNEPLRYEQMMSRPQQFINRTLFGRA